MILNEKENVLFLVYSFLILVIIGSAVWIFFSFGGFKLLLTEQAPAPAVSATPDNSAVAAAKKSALAQLAGYKKYGSWPILTRDKDRNFIFLSAGRGNPFVKK